MMPEMEQVRDAALKYDKPTLARMAQMGQLSPTIAVMAGMMRDRIVQSETKPPNPPTVAEEVMRPQMGLAAAQQMQGQPQPQAPGQGIDQIPVPDQMFEPQGMAGGGIVAFQAGGPSFTSALAGDVPADPRYLRAYQAARGERMPRKELVDLMTLQELQEYNRSGTIPERLSGQVQGRMIEGVPMFGGDMYTPKPLPAPVDDSAEMAKFRRQAQIPPVDDSAEMAKLIRQSGEIGVPGTPGLKAPPVQEKKEIIKPVAKKEGTAEKPKAFDPITQLEEYERRLGILADPDKETREELDAATKKLGEDKDRNANMAILKAGLAMMGGESPYAFVNIAKGGMAGLEDYGKSEAERRKEEKELMKARADLRRADEARKQGRLKEAITLEQNYFTNTLNIERTEAIKLQAQAAMIQAQRGPTELQTYETWAAQQKAAGKPSDMESFRRSAPTVEAARIKLMSDAMEAVNKSFEPGGAYNMQYKKILKDKGQAEADRFKQGKLLEQVTLMTDFLNRGTGLGMGGSGVGTSTGSSLGNVIDYSSLMGNR